MADERAPSPSPRAALPDETPSRPWHPALVSTGVDARAEDVAADRAPLEADARFVLRHELGRGGMGVVWRALSLLLVQLGANVNSAQADGRRRLREVVKPLLEVAPQDPALLALHADLLPPGSPDLAEAALAPLREALAILLRRTAGAGANWRSVHLAIVSGTETHLWRAGRKHDAVATFLQGEADREGASAGVHLLLINHHCLEATRAPEEAAQHLAAAREALARVPAPLRADPMLQGSWSAAERRLEAATRQLTR